MKLLVDLFGQLAADAIDAAQVFDRGTPHAIKSAELRQQLAPPHRTDAGDVLELGAPAILGAPRPMSGDGETVGLVADFLDQVEAGVVRGQLCWPRCRSRPGSLGQRRCLPSAEGTIALRWAAITAGLLLASGNMAYTALLALVVAFAKPDVVWSLGRAIRRDAAR